MIWSLTGPSASGKTTIARLLQKAVPEAKPLMSVTTRPPRPSDNPGEYEYVSEAQFSSLSRAREFLWEVAPHGHRYATRKSRIDEALAEGIFIPIIVIEAVVKLHAYAAAQGKADSVRSLYIRMSDEEELRRRFSVRGDDPADMERRIAQCRDWNARARSAGIPFYMMDGEGTPESKAEEALAFFKADPSSIKIDGVQGAGEE